MVMIGIAAGLLAQAAAATATAMAPLVSPAPSVTIEDVSRRQADAESLSFQGHGLVGTFKAPDAPPVIAALGLDGIVPLVQGATGSVSPDGQWLLYLSGEQWRLRNLKTGEERHFEVGSSATPRGPPLWSDDSTAVATHYDLPPAAAIPLSDRAVHLQVLEPTPDAVRRRASGGKRSHLLLWRTTADQPSDVPVEATDAYPGGWRGHGYSLAYIYAVGQIDYGGQPPSTAIMTISPDGRVLRQLYKVHAFSQALRPRVSPDGQHLAFAVDLNMPEFGVANDVVLMTPDGDHLKRLTSGRDVAELQWGGDNALYLLMRHGGLQQLSRMDLQGRITPLTHDSGDRTDLVASNDGQRIGYRWADGYGRKELRTWLVKEGREVTERVLVEPSKHLALGRFEAVSWRTPDGLRLKGFLVFPPTFQAGQRYPLFVDVHGGGPGVPLTLFSLLGRQAQTPLEWHMWADLGFVVFVPDYRSSGEYGPSVNRRRDRGPGGDRTGLRQDVADVESGLRWIISTGFIDRHRIVVFGQSAGGGRVNLLLTQGHRYAAAIIHDPIPSGHDAEALRAAALGLPVRWSQPFLTPGQRRGELNGFLFDGWRSSTPTLIMVGNPDHGAVDPLSAETLFSMLLSRHVPTRFVRYIDDGHVPTTAAGIEDRYHQMLSWMDRYAPSGRLADKTPQALCGGSGLGANHLSADHTHRSSHFADCALSDPRLAMAATLERRLK